MTLLNNILPEQRRGKLKALLKKGKTVRVLEAHNGLSGIIANNAHVKGELEGIPVIREFDALWESSLTDSASKGHPDIEVVTFDSRLQTINEIVLIPWVRYVSTLKSSGIWEGILDKMFKLGQGKPHGDVDQIMDVLETLERIYLIEVMTGPTWETTWTKQNA